MLSPRRTPFLVALLVGSVALAACADGGAEPSDTSSDDAADTTTSTSEAAAAVGKGKGTFVVGDRTYTFEAKRCSAENPLISRSILNSSSIRRTASAAIGALLTAAISNSLRRACAQHAASRIGPGSRFGS